MKKLSTLGSLAAVLSLTTTLALGSACTASFSDEDGDGSGGDGSSSGSGNTNCDQDHDGHNAVGCNDGSNRPQDDCDDTSALRTPGKPEGTQCDGIDNDCNFLIDDGVPGCTPPTDSDGDGVPDNQDCAPNDSSVCPGHVEVCGDNKDNNCNGQTDEGCSQSSASCGSGCNGSSTSGNPTTSGGGAATCQVTFSISGLQATGSKYVFGEFQTKEYIPYEAHWAPIGYCTQQSPGLPSNVDKLCDISSGTCTITVPNHSFVLGQVTGVDNNVYLTKCRHYGDQACWSGGGQHQTNGTLTASVNGIITGAPIEDNSDSLDDPGGLCYGYPTQDPACCKTGQAESSKIITGDFRLPVDC